MWALLPLKDLVQAKSRLSGVLAPHERRALAQAMVEDVLAALVGHGGLSGVLLVSDDPSAELLAHRYGVETIREEALGSRGLNGVVSAASRRLADAGAGDIMVLHGDLPLLRAADVEALLATYAEPDVDLVLGPDLAGQGTNVMIFPADNPPTFHYGAGSLLAHQAAAEAAGLRHCSVERVGIGLDVDSPEDLLALYHRLVDGADPGLSGRLLLDNGIGQRLDLMEGSGLGAAGEAGERHDTV
jgi:2-phospho-L-lactate guanylyltransferase